MAQEMSVEFSVSWGEKGLFTMTEIPSPISPVFLNITYRNLSDQSLYCLKVAGGIADLPEIMVFRDAITQNGAKNMLTYPQCKFEEYSKRKYIVGIQSNPYFSSMVSWNVRNDTADHEYKKFIKDAKSPVYDIVLPDANGKIWNDSLFGKPIGGDSAILYDWMCTDVDKIYNAIYTLYYPTDESFKMRNREHYLSDIRQDTIMNTSLRKFVFLKPGETLVEKYNLIGFQIVGGTFTFQLDNTKSLDYVEVQPDVDAIDTYEIVCENNIRHIRKKLPLKVGEYKLFSGNFLNNKTTVSFSGVKIE